MKRARQLASKQKKSMHQWHRVTGEHIAILFVGLAVIFGVSVLGYSLLSSSSKQQEHSAPQKESRFGDGMTSFDQGLALEFMDKNHDGKCDSCGMPVEMCISSGQLQCNMDPKSTIGILGSDHLHADWKIYINGKPLDLSDKAHMERMKKDLPVSSFIHVDSGAPAPERTGEVLHMHATGVPLWIFFESIGMKFDSECLVLDDGMKHCNNDKKTLKFFVNGEPNEQYEQYVFLDHDKILISYGDKNEDVGGQLASVTSFSKTH